MVYLNKLCKKEGLAKLPTLTQARKRVATATSSMDDQSQALLAKHMSHSKEVHAQYYQASHTSQEVAWASKLITTLFEGTVINI